MAVNSRTPMDDLRKHAWICTGCLASWVFQTTEEALEAEQASRLHQCPIEGATSVLVDASSIPALTRRFGRGADGNG